MTLKLTGIAGSLMGRTILIQGMTVIGRGSSANLRLVDRHVSRIHATIEGDGAQWTITVVGRNGMRLSRERQVHEVVDASVDLVDGDVVVVGADAFVVSMDTVLRSWSPGQRAA